MDQAINQIIYLFGRLVNKVPRHIQTNADYCHNYMCKRFPEYKQACDTYLQLSQLENDA